MHRKQYFIEIHKVTKNTHVSTINQAVQSNGRWPQNTFRKAILFILTSNFSFCNIIIFYNIVAFGKHLPIASHNTMTALSTQQRFSIRN
jgi:hypothetical protein